ncbi:MAG TPA: glycogen synthase GlgA [Candidatus Limnocylindrales bacterium]|jgi:starch synthase|nr:glycogen synthase GlgA [Candidatus Limnocylindrales bacterium]
MNIVFAASECVPYSKTGGLADVVGALPQALASLGHNVSVYVPRYRQTRLANAKTALRSITIPFDDQYRFCSVLDGGKNAGVQFYFIEYPQFFDRDALYGTPAGDYPDNAERFALFSRAVLEATKILGVPDIFHCHDWQSALIPVLLRTSYLDDPVFHNTATVFTIHNMGYQGLFPPDILPLLMLPWDLFTMDKMEYWGKVNFLKGALGFSDYITTVSRKYSQEIQTAEFGFGLDGVLRDRAGTVTGILNGVDYNEWSPEKDKLIVRQYSPEKLEGKRECKYDLLRQFGLESADASLPVIGIVSRFAAQKGFDLIAEVADDMAQLPVIFTILGSGDKEYQDLFIKLNRLYPEKFAVKVAYDNTVAHKIEAGADMFLMPSRYEPSGLNQMYSLKYGTVPIVRATGGLDDSIEPWDAATGKGTGFKFVPYSAAQLLNTIHDAINAFRDKPNWNKLMLNGMAKDFSWTASAREYVKIYERLCPPKAPGQEKVLEFSRA